MKNKKINTWRKGFFIVANNAARDSREMTERQTLYCYRNDINGTMTYTIGTKPLYTEDIYIKCFFSTKVKLDTRTLQSIFKNAEHYQSETTI